MSLLALPFALFLACGGNEPDSKAPQGGTTPADSAAPAAGGAQTGATPAAGGLPAFSTLTSKEQQMDRMKTVVMPKMSKVFTDHDATKYASFSCKTCHGPEYKQPQQFLPKLKLSGDGFQKMSADKPDIVKWMHESVEPQMAAAMGEKPYDMKTPNRLRLQRLPRRRVSRARVTRALSEAAFFAVISALSGGL